MLSTQVKILRKRLKKAQIKTYESKYFLPFKERDKVLADDEVRECIRQAQIDISWQEHCVEAVLNGGRSLLALLILVERVDLLVQFLETAQSTLDSRLPLNADELKRITKDDEDDGAIDIYRRQWEVTAPVFHVGQPHWSYLEGTILPFIESSPIGHGAFGEVFAAKLPKGHHGFDSELNEETTVVLKRLKPQNDSQDKNDQSALAYENEYKVAALLQSLKHENIIRFLTSFTIEGDHPTFNFLFARAETSLSKILYDNEKNALDAFFPTEYSLFRQLFGLTSAVESLHEFHIEKWEITFVGCHYDIAPRNILVQHEKLLLSDFGLSRLHPDTSQSIFSKGQGDYLAPECLVLEDGNFTKGSVGRASDRWSLGCIFLELYIYFNAQGKKAQSVRAFRESRQTTSFGGEYKACPFHQYDKPSPAVSRKMNDLIKESETDARKKHLWIIEDMLNMDPAKRPSTGLITEQVFLQAQEIICNQTLLLFDQLILIAKTFELLIERERFFLWTETTLFDFGKRAPTSAWDESFPHWLRDSRHSIDQLLYSIHKEVTELMIIMKANTDHHMPIFTRLRRLNGDLWTRLPPDLRTTLKNRLESNLLSREELQSVVTPADVQEMPALNKDISLLISMKHMTALFKKGRAGILESKRLLLAEEEIPETQEIGVQILGEMHRADSAPKKILLEYVSYNPIEHRHLDDLYGRVDDLAELLNHDWMPNGFRILKCSGYFLNTPENAIGMVYDFPPGLAPTTMPLSLKTLIQKFRKPTLGALFQLACSISRCVAQFHQTEWLHKNISSYNVLFFNDALSASYEHIEDKQKSDQPDRLNVGAQDSTSSGPQESYSDLRKRTEKSRFSIFHKKLRTNDVPKSEAGSKGPLLQNSRAASPSQSIKPTKLPQGDTTLTMSPESEGALPEPYLVGFNHSREDKDAAFTTGPNEEGYQKPYQYPSYQRLGQRSGQHLRFKAEFDYYSVGIVLLELGLWKPLEDLVEGSINNYLEKANPWVDDVVPHLGSAVGATYRDVVRECLGGMSQDDTDKTKRAPVVWFNEVITKLERCYA